MHSHQLELVHVDVERGNIFSETEGFVVAIQDRIIATKNYRRHILHEEIDDLCRKCNAVGETIEYIIAGCPALAERAYLVRYTAVTKIVHQHLALKPNLVNQYAPYY